MKKNWDGTQAQGQLYSRVCAVFLIFACALLSTAPAHADPKIAVVNFQKLLADAPQAKASMSALQSEFASRRSSLLTMQSQAVSSLDENFRQEYQRQAAAFQKDASARRDEEIRKVQNFLVREIQNYASVQGYGLVMGDGVFFANEQLDITDNVLTVLNKEPTTLPLVSPTPSTSTSFPGNEKYKIGVVNFDELLEKAPQTKYAMSALEDEFASRRSSLLGVCPGNGS